MYSDGSAERTSTRIRIQESEGQNQTNQIAECRKRQLVTALARRAVQPAAAAASRNTKSRCQISTCSRSLLVSCIVSPCQAFDRCRTRPRWHWWRRYSWMRPQPRDSHERQIGIAQFGAPPPNPSLAELAGVTPMAMRLAPLDGLVHSGQPGECVEGAALARRPYGVLRAAHAEKSAQISHDAYVAARELLIRDQMHAGAALARGRRRGNRGHES